MEVTMWLKTIFDMKTSLTAWTSPLDLDLDPGRGWLYRINRSGPACPKAIREGGGGCQTRHSCGMLP